VALGDLYQGGQAEQQRVGAYHVTQTARNLLMDLDDAGCRG
jgi:hypothetical protein